MSAGTLPSKTACINVNMRKNGRMNTEEARMKTSGRQSGGRGRVDVTEAEAPPLADAHRAIGAFFCTFSRVEHELGESVKAVYGLQNNDASDAIVAALGDVARKASLVLAASKGAKDANGSEASAEWKAKVETTIKCVFDCNNNNRVPLAHSLLQPNADGSVDLVHLKIDKKGKVQGKNGVKWSQGDFREKIQRLNKLADELELLNRELRTFKYVIPDLDLGWMGMMTPQGIPHALLATISNAPA